MGPSKLLSMKEAVARFVPDGASVCLGTGLEAVIPFAAGHELIRQGKRELTLIGPISDMLFDQLIGGGCGRKVVAAWVGNVIAGLGHNYRRAVEHGLPHPIEIEDHSNLTLSQGLLAGALGTPYIPTRSLLGTGILESNRSFRRGTEPWSGEPLLLVPGLPLLAFALAKRTHAPRALGLFKNGIVRESPAPETPFTVSDPPNIAGALWSTSTGNIMAILQQGLVDLGFIGGAEVDKYGNLNTSYIGDWRTPKVKLPGSGGGGDIASLAKRFVIIMAQEKHRFRERVDYVTSPGYGDGRDWRRRVGLRGGGPLALITTLGVFRFHPETKEASLASFHRGQSVDSIRAETGWDLTVAPDVGPTPEPTSAELEIVRASDPQGFWTR